VFVDIGNVAFFLVETLPRKFAFLVDAKNLRYQSHVQSEKKENGGNGMAVLGQEK
jgi:hypothetical protein